MIKVDCKMCGRELEEAGALVISPPQDRMPYSIIEERVHEKYHICVKCYDKLFDFIECYEEDK